MESFDFGIYDMLGMDADPFRNGRGCCCIVHTSAGRYRQALNELREGKGHAPSLLDELEASFKDILSAGYRMSSVWAKLYVLEMVA